MPRSVDFIPQMEAAECGAASLAMVLAYHGHHAPLAEVREKCGVSRDGATAKGILDAAAALGLRAKAHRLEPADLARFAERPMILHWEMNHFVVLERWTPDLTRIVDPAIGPRDVSARDLDGSFTGIAIELTPATRFVKRPPERPAMRRALELLRGARVALGFTLVSSLLLDVLAIALPLATQVVIDHVLLGRQADWLVWTMLSALAAVVVSTTFGLLRGALLLRIKQALDDRMTSELVRHLLGLPLAFFFPRHAAELSARVRSSVVVRDLIAGQAMGALVDGVMLVAYLALMLLFDARLGAIVVVAGTLYVLVYLLARPHQRRRFQERELSGIKEHTRLVQTIQGVVTVKSAGAEAASRSRWLGLFLNTLNATEREAALQDLVGTLLSLVRAVVPVLVLWIGGERVLAGELTPGTLITFQMLQAGFLLPLEQILDTLLRLQAVPVLLGRMDDVLASDLERPGGEPCPALAGEVTLEKVSFRYGSRSPLVVTDMSLRIRRGEKVAFVGPSGCGKSTVARLLMGLYAPTSGRILLDGHDLAGLDLAGVRRQYGVVLQETALFEGTIRDNIALFYQSAPFEEIVNAAQVARIHEDIQRLPRGYDTPISDALCPLSGGQRQRLALARAILHRPPIMILDEATSALDAITESAIEQYLATRTCTRIVIAHRLSTVRDADRIFVMDGGRIVEEGRHRELVERGGKYAELVLLGERDAPAEHHEEAVKSSAAITPTDLERFSLFASWTETERIDLAASLVRIEANAGETLLAQDERAGGLSLIERGKVSIQIDEPGLAPFVVSELGPGQLFGEVGLLDGSASSASAIATEPVSILRLSTDTFRELRERGDLLGARLTLALGGIVAKRTRAAIASTRVILEGDGSGGSARESAPTSLRFGRGRVLRLGETSIGGTLSETEVAAIESTGEVRTLAGGDVLFAEGDRSEHVFVLLAGKLTLMRGPLPAETVEPGGTAGRLAAFDAEPRAEACLAIGPTTVFALRRDAFHALLRDGHGGAGKVLAHLTQSAVGALRVANFRLREAAAKHHGEVAAIREAQAMHGAFDASPDLAGDGGKVPRMKEAHPSQSLATCVAAVLAYWGRPAPVMSVIEACVHGDRMTDESLGRGLGTFGMTLRAVHLGEDDLPYIDAPLVLATRKGGYVVVEADGTSHVRFMDPSQGARRSILRRDLYEELSGDGYEILVDHATSDGSPAKGLAGVLASHRGALLQVASATTLLELGRVAIATAVAFVVGEVLPELAQDTLRLVALAVLAITITQFFLSQLQASLLRHLRTTIDRHLVDQLMGHVLKLPLSFFERHEPGETWQRFQSFRVVRDLLSNSGLSAVLGAGSLLVSSALLGAVDARLLMPVLGTLAIHLLAALYTAPKLRRLADDETTLGATQQGKLLELLGGIATVRMAGDATVGLRMWLPGFREELRLALTQERALLWFIGLLDAARQLAMVAVLWLGARAVLAHEATTTSFLTAVGITTSLLFAVRVLTFETLALARGLVHVRRVRELFRQKHEQLAGAARSPGKLRGAITLENVSFRYAEDAPFVLRDVSIEIPTGAKVALVGASGSGKSTLGKLLLGFHLPTSGRILFDGKDLSGLDLAALRQQIGVVLQDTYLFGSSIRENLTLNAPGASLDEIRDAARRAFIHADIQAMPMAYDTMLAEGGKTLSGGQRQRLAIARALVHRPSILLLDEATSALDNQAQAAVEANLGGPRVRCTRIVIAHRLSAIVDADLIVVVARGQVVEKGTHAELVALGGHYHALVRAQLAPFGRSA